jgi:hypothetical protein
MGAHPWRYLVPYDPDLGKALAELREREFIAGRYNPAEPFPGFPADPLHAPGAKHRTIDMARQAAGASGTRSILDMLRTSAKPGPGAVTPLDENDLTDVFSTREAGIERAAFVGSDAPGLAKQYARYAVHM